jgi:F-type H+-transporting ATPase subunit a
MMEALYDIGITNQMITSTVITLFICTVVIIAGRHMQMIPTGLQNIMEIVVEKLQNFYISVMGEYAGRKYFPLVATLFIYILVCNYSGLLPLAGHFPGLAAPTSSINFPLGMALVVFVATISIGLIENRGPKYFKSLFRPVPFLFPIMLLEQLVHPVSLTLRLYGNIYGEEAVVASFFELVPLGIPIIMQALSVLMGLIQALVFSLLAGIYISEAAEPVDGELHHQESCEIPVQQII